jgi:hypothetical protein
MILATIGICIKKWNSALGIKTVLIVYPLKRKKKEIPNGQGE